MNLREEIINTPEYWVEKYNDVIYDAIVGFMEEHKLNKTQMSEHLGISLGRLSQYLNDGQINFRLENFIKIGLKLRRVTLIKLIDTETYLHEEERQRIRKHFNTIQATHKRYVKGKSNYIKIPTSSTPLSLKTSHFDDATILEETDYNNA